jgi:hypothetical protein
LPWGYQEVEWIKQPSSRTAYINTNYEIQPGITRIVNYGIAFFDGDSNNAFGARKGINGTTNLAYGTNNSGEKGFQALFKGGDWVGSKKGDVNRLYKIECQFQEGLQTLSVDDELYITRRDTGLNYNDFVGYPAFLFCMNLGYRALRPGTNDYSNSSMCAVEISLDGEIKRFYIPCYRKVDSKPGMYDLAGSICPLTNSPFYINAGTGEFLVGPDVN